MAKMPFFQFYPLDWLRDTAKLSPEAQGHWIKILCFAWNEPNRGIYKRQETAMCYELNVDTMGLKDTLEELSQVADVTVDNGDVTIVSRRMVREERDRELGRNRQYKHRSNASVTQESRSSHANVTPNKLEVISQKLEVIKDNTITPEAVSVVQTGVGDTKKTEWFSKLWTLYPQKGRIGRKASLKHFLASVHDLDQAKLCAQALERYIGSKRVKGGFIQNGPTWFNNWQDWVHYVEEKDGTVNC